MRRHSIRSLGLAGVVGVLLASGCGKPQASFDDIMKEGVAEYEAHNYR